MTKQYKYSPVSNLLNFRFLVNLSLFCLVFFVCGCSNTPYALHQNRKKVLYLEISQDAQSLDPSVAYDAASESIVGLLYPSYFKYDYLKRNPFQLDLNLGAAMPVVKPYLITTSLPNGSKKYIHGQLWTFRVRPNIYFQNDPCFPGGQGREIVGADFLYSFRRMADPEVPCPIVSYFDHKIEGMQAFEDYNRKRMEQHETIDMDYPIPGLQLDPKHPHVFRILLMKPYPQLRYLMAMTLTSPLAREAVDRYGEGLARHPVGCGQFILKSYTPRGSYVMEVNPNRPYMCYPTIGMPGDRKAGLLTDAGKRLPFVQQIRFSIMPEATTVWNEFQQGYLDVTGVGQNNFQEAMPHVSQLSPELKKRGVHLEKSVGLDIYYYIFNMDDPLVGGFSRRATLLRQAISLTIDSKEEIDLESLGLGMPAQWLLPPGLFGYNPHYENPFRQTSIQKAKQLLAEAGYPNGIDPSTHRPLVIYYDNEATSAQARQGLAITQREIGVLGINLVSRSWRVSEFHDRIDNGQFQFSNWGWGADYPDPENFAFLLYSRNRRPGPNVSDYNNPTYDVIFRQLRAMTDTPERYALIQKLYTISATDCPLIYQFHTIQYGLVQPWLLNYKSNSFSVDAPDYYNINLPLRNQLRSKWNHPQIWPIVLLVIIAIVAAIPAVAVVHNKANRHIRRTSPNNS